jgi:hypothetical protein
MGFKETWLFCMCVCPFSYEKERGNVAFAFSFSKKIYSPWLRAVPHHTAFAATLLLFFHIRKNVWARIIFYRFVRVDKDALKYLKRVGIRRRQVFGRKLI